MNADRRSRARGPALAEERAHRVALDGDEAEGLGDYRRDEHRLSGQEVQLAEEAQAPVADDLGASGVDDRDLAFEDGDEWIARVANPIQDVTDVRCALLADLGQRRELRGGQSRTSWRRDLTLSGWHPMILSDLSGRVA
jgi:hypothetical protein